jgi:hypothetical protein
MAVRNKTLKDLRSNARITAFLDCQVIHENKTHDAVIADLSRKGALLASSFLPATGEKIGISIQSSLIKKHLSLSGTVGRCTRETSGQGEKGQFVVRFDQCPLDLVTLITKLHAKQEEYEAQLNDW